MNALAALVTLRIYGTWLPGDARGSVGRHGPRAPGAPRRDWEPALEAHARALLRNPPPRLGELEQGLVASALREAAARQGWALEELHVGEDHSHLVARAPVRVGRVVGYLKARATHALRSAGRLGAGDQLWASGFSVRYLFTQAELDRARGYVRAHGHRESIPALRAGLPIPGPPSAAGAPT